MGLRYDFFRKADNGQDHLITQLCTLVRKVMDQLLKVEIVSPILCYVPIVLLWLLTNGEELADQIAVFQQL